MVRFLTKVWLASLLTFHSVFIAPLPQAEAAGPATPVLVVAAAGVTITALEAAVITVTTAAAIGIITISQSKAMQRDLRVAIDRIKQATSDSIDAAIQAAGIVLEKVESTTKKPSRSTTGSTVAEGECPVKDREDPRKCCPKFIKSFQGGAGASSRPTFLVPSGPHAFQVMDSSTGKMKCCLEWDSRHGRFEVYTAGGAGKDPKGGADPYTHQGELKCGDREIDDPCDANEPGKADNSGGHAPRNGCKKLGPLQKFMQFLRGGSPAGRQ